MTAPGSGPGPVAVVYQAVQPPEIDGIRKPMKPGGYSDSGADIAYVLRSQGVAVATPTSDPEPGADMDWVFPDTDAGIADALAAGARVLWANTVLFEGHPLETARLEGARIVGQRPSVVHAFDDKWRTNSLLRGAGLPVARAGLVSSEPVAGSFRVGSITEDDLRSVGVGLPAIVKPVRGRGSQGVAKVDSIESLRTTASALLEERVVVDGSHFPKYGNTLIVEEYLPATEVTVTVMPPGSYVIDGEERVEDRHWALPPVRRFNHVDGITPYNGVVAVTQNSEVVTDPVGRHFELMAHCETAAAAVDAVAPIRIDCRARKDGEFVLFDLNMKPNMTGAGRPGRGDQDSLSCMAARAVGWSFADLLVNMLRQAWDPQGAAAS